MTIEGNCPTSGSLLLRPGPYCIFSETPIVLFGSVPWYLVSLAQRWGNWFVVYTTGDGLPNSVRRKTIGLCCSH
jgi:hypothetical protein